MKNFEKYTSAKERYSAFIKFCHNTADTIDCENCPIFNLTKNGIFCDFLWLEMEADI